MEIIIFTAVGIALYLISDRLLTALEKLHGEPLPQRNIIFFVLILVLSLSTFSVMNSYFGGDEGPQDDDKEQQAADGGNQPTQAH